MKNYNLNALPDKAGVTTAPAQKPWGEDMLAPATLAKIQSLLPVNLRAEHFVQGTLLAIRKQPLLMKCNRGSLWQSIQECARLGLLPDGKKASLVPFKDACTLIVGYQGFAELVRRAQPGCSIHADVVYENDRFEFEFGTEASMVHRPVHPRGGDITHAYAYIKYPQSGGVDFEVLGIDEVLSIRDASKSWQYSGKSSVWGTNFGEMAKKTAFRRLAKYLLMGTPEYASAVAVDDDDYRFENAKPVQAPEPEAPAVEPGPEPDRLDKLAKEVGREMAEQVTQPVDRSQLFTPLERLKARMADPDPPVDAEDVMAAMRKLRLAIKGETNLEDLSAVAIDYAVNNWSEVLENIPNE
jgi:recombination protein RecT